MRVIKSAAMIVNAKSRKGQDLFAHACAAMKGLPFPVDAHAVRDPKELEATMDAALARKPDLMILGGGDGTVSGLVDKLVSTDVALAVLPLGTANSFARTLGVPLDIDGAIGVIAGGHFKRIDLGMIDDDYFANGAAIGIAPQIAQRIPHHLKKYLGRAGYLGWAAWEFLRFKPFTLIVGEGPTERRIAAVEVRISNGPYHGGTEVNDQASVDNGVIVVQAVTGHVKRRLVKNWAASLLRLEARHETTQEIIGTSLRIRTEPPLPISIDGEVLATTPVTARVAAGIIEVMVPAPEVIG
ncbi:diacylglycerol kinase [Sphingomonas sp. HMWF008]|nr:diacylglycerol kinase [Sphingomonas sp. HMWF008]